MSKTGKNYAIPLSLISLKDRKIIRELFADARTPYSRIAKKIGVSKEVVHYRVNRLLNSGILLRFNTIIDVQKMGWEIYFARIRFQSITAEDESHLLELINKHGNVAQILRCIGNTDLILKLFVKNYKDANAVVKELEASTSIVFSNYSLDLVEKEVPVPLPFFYEPLELPKSAFTEVTSTSKIPVSQNDLKILGAISHHARKSTVHIGNEVGLSRELVSYHLKKLEKSGVIHKYRPSAWSGSKQIGYSWYMVMLNLQNVNKSLLTSLREYILTHGNMTYYYETLGSNDIYFEIRLKTSDELNDVLMNIRSILKEKLKSHSLSIILKEHKYTYFPDCLLASNC